MVKAGISSLLAVGLGKKDWRWSFFLSVGVGDALPCFWMYVVSVGLRGVIRMLLCTLRL